MSEAVSGDPQRVTKRLATTIAAVAQAVVWICGGVSIAGFLLASVAWPCELMCHFRVQYFVTLVVCAGVFLVLRRWRWGAVAGVLAAINAWPLAPYYFRPSITEPAGTHVRLASINVYSANREYQRVVDLVRKWQPDVFAVVEITPQWERALEVLHEEYPQRLIQSRSDNFGIALYSRLPLESAEFVALSENDDAIVAVADVEGRPVTIFAAHVFPPGGRGTAMRDRQLRVLGRLVANVDGACVVVGDLNTTPFSPIFDELLETAGLEDARRGGGVQPTWPVGRFVLRIPIDHALTKGVAAAHTSIGPDVGSDHFPIVVDVMVP